MLIGKDFIANYGSICSCANFFPQCLCAFLLFVLPVYRTDAGHRVAVTHTLSQEPVSNLPGEHGGILTLVLCYFVHHFWSSHLRLGASDHTRFYAPCLVVSGTGIIGPMKYLLFSNI